jgi:hypothetical protein
MTGYEHTISPTFWRRATLYGLPSRWCAVWLGTLVLLAVAGAAAGAAQGGLLGGVGGAVGGVVSALVLLWAAAWAFRVDPDTDTLALRRFQSRYLEGA